MPTLRTITHDTTAWFEVPLDPPAGVANSTTWTLRDGTGAVVNAYTGQTTTHGAGALSVALQVPSAGNQKLSNEDVAERFLEVSWTPQGAFPRLQTVAYRVAAWMPISATPDDVRSVLGLNTAELADTDVDLVGAALALRSEMSSTTFPTSARTAQRLIVLRAALDLKGSLALRVAQSMSSDNAGFKRLAKIDLDGIVATIEQEYRGLLEALAPALAASSFSIIAAAGPTTDAITGS